MLVVNECHPLSSWLSSWLYPTWLYLVMIQTQTDTALQMCNIFAVSQCSASMHSSETSDSQLTNLSDSLCQTQNQIRILQLNY